MKIIKLNNAWPRGEVTHSLMTFNFSLTLTLIIVLIIFLILFFGISRKNRN